MILTKDQKNLFNQVLIHYLTIVKHETEVELIKRQNEKYLDGDLPEPSELSWMAMERMKTFGLIDFEVWT